MSTVSDIAAKLNSYKRSNGQRMFYVTDAGIVLDSPVVSGNEVAAVMSDGVTETFRLNVNCFRMIRTRKVETTESWTLDE
jgi:hypothetical protein